MTLLGLGPGPIFGRSRGWPISWSCPRFQGARARVECHPGWNNDDLAKIAGYVRQPDMFTVAEKKTP